MNSLLERIVNFKKKENSFDKFKFFEFINKFLTIIRKIKLYDKQFAAKLYFLKKNFLLIDMNKKKMKLLIKKLLNKLYFDINYIIKSFKRKRRKFVRKYKKRRRVYKLILKNTTNNFFIIFTTLKGKVI